MTIEVPLSPVFKPLVKRVRFKGAHGGRSSGKSHFFATMAVIKGVEKPLRILCCREVQRSLSESVKALIERKVASLGYGHMLISQRNLTMLTNGTTFLYEGLRADPGAIMSMEDLDIAYVEQAERISKASLDILVPTVRKNGSELWFAWNPKTPKDAIEQLLRGPEPPPIVPELEKYYDKWVEVIEANPEDNKLLPAVMRYQIDLMKRTDPEKYAHVYGGNYLMRSETQVFNNWRQGERAEIDAARKEMWASGNGRYYFGADFGIAADPTVLVRCFMLGRRIYIDAEAYAYGVSVDFIPFLFGGCYDEALITKNEDAFDDLPREYRKWRGIPGARPRPGQPGFPIQCDSANTYAIDYLQRHGFPNAVSVIKSHIEDGIEYLNSFQEIVVSEDCPNTFDEFVSYRWRTDARTDEVLPRLEDKDNHAIDAVRYAIEATRRAAASSSPIKGLY